jgi:2,3-bisphosphoglycerate-dependent phosphoglycerate mutase
MTQLYLIRHGDYLEIMEEKLVDHGLSTLGVRQVELLRDRMAKGLIKADVLVASTLLRAKQTAEMIAPALDLPIEYDMDFEEWRTQDGSLTDEQFVSKWYELSPEHIPYSRWMDGYETWMEFQLRATSAMHHLLLKYEGKTIVLVCHGGIIEASFVYFFGLSRFCFPKATVEAHQTAITHWAQVDYPGVSGIWVLQTYNDDRHLEGIGFEEA